MGLKIRHIHSPGDYAEHIDQMAGHFRDHLRMLPSAVGSRELLQVSEQESCISQAVF